MRLIRLINLRVEPRALSHTHGRPGRADDVTPGMVVVYPGWYSGAYTQGGIAGHIPRGVPIGGDTSHTHGCTIGIPPIPTGIAQGTPLRTHGYSTGYTPQDPRV